MQVITFTSSFPVTATTISAFLTPASRSRRALAELPCKTFTSISCSLAQATGSLVYDGYIMIRIKLAGYEKTDLASSGDQDTHIISSIILE